MKKYRKYEKEKVLEKNEVSRAHLIFSVRVTGF